MKKFITLILITFLWIGTASAYITAEERAKFDYHLKRIEDSQRLYKERKKALRKSEQRRIEQKRAKIRRKKQLENVAKRNTRLARERLIRNDAERIRNLKSGQCTTSALTGRTTCR